MITLHFRSLTFIATLFTLPVLAAASPVRQGGVEVELVSEAARITPGRSFTVALRMQHEPHWHSYWIAPGTGYATSLAWTLPEGFSAGAIQWPTPEVVRDSAGVITGNGYVGDISLLVEITPPATLAADSVVKLEAAADWLMCQDVCMPGKAHLELNLPVGSPGADAPDARWAGFFTSARDRLPQAGDDWEVSATHTAAAAILRLRQKSGAPHQPTGLHFFASDGFTDYAREPVVRPENGGWAMEIPLEGGADRSQPRLAGVLASDNGWRAGSGHAGLKIDASFATGLVPGSPPVATAASSLLATLAFAFVGGLVLNLMPCVFPVLGIKILGFVNQSGHDRRKITLHGLVFALGVLVSFWTLAGVLLVLRAGGSQLGWGFQLQSPGFVFCLAVFMLIFALNMSGLFEVGLAATGVGGRLQMKDGFGGSFFTGALATLVATPCSAPFLAPALGAALSLPAVSSLLIFTAIAVGLALPYLLLSIFPEAVRVLPRPGAWMETFKQFMAFPLYATVAWLLWVLAGQTRDDDNALLLVAFGLVLTAMAAWAYGRFGQAHGKAARQTFGRILAGGLLAAGLYTGWPKGLPAAPTDGSYQVVWEKWSPEAVARAQQAGKYVYVDFTARWCATCQTNKAAVFHSSDVLAEFGRKGVVLLRGDWTNRDPQITAELARWNRSAVPFNLIYGPGKPEPVALPELLSPAKILDAFVQVDKIPLG